MKITKTNLIKIIKEEVEKVKQIANDADYAGMSNDSKLTLRTVARKVLDNSNDFRSFMEYLDDEIKKQALSGNTGSLDDIKQTIVNFVSSFAPTLKINKSNIDLGEGEEKEQEKEQEEV
tara:strand:- start:2239 stop:2595 length:357 start_codon:yes stop_codon:yes gene_type:complete